MQIALSLACCLGFAHKINGSATPLAYGAAADARGAAAAGTATHSQGCAASGDLLNNLQTRPESLKSSEGASDASEGGFWANNAATSRPSGSGGGASAHSGAPRGTAIVVDSEVVSCLMMGALSPGLKRHSVTLFEAGRVTGSEVMKEMVRELWASYEVREGFVEFSQASYRIQLWIKQLVLFISLHLPEIAHV